MLDIYWFGLGAVAVMMTMTWLVFEPEEKVNFTAGIGGTAWILMALTARGVQRMTESGEMVPADAGVVVQLFVAILGLLSFLTIVLYRAGLYPPDTDELADDKRMKA